jgi:hypothetical protein
LARFPVNKAILIQYPSYSFKNTSEAANMVSTIRESIDEARMIREVANHHGLPVVDTYYVLKQAAWQNLHAIPPLKKRK